MTFKEKVEKKNRYSFSIGYDGSDENAMTHRMFKEFSERTDKVYIAALRMLLEDYNHRRRYEEIMQLVDEKNIELAELRALIEEKKEDVKSVKPQTFGGEKDE